MENPPERPQQASTTSLEEPAELQFVVELMPEAKETAQSDRASVAEPGQDNSTEKGSRWRLKARLLGVFVAFSYGGQNHRSAKTLEVLSLTSLDRSRPD